MTKGMTILEYCDPQRAAALAAAPNIKALRKRKTGEIRQLVLEVAPEYGDRKRSRGGPASKYTYDEAVAGQQVTTLKRLNGDGTFVRWSDRDGFDPLRFNPDQIPPPLKTK